LESDSPVKFNLIHEPWIVVRAKDGIQKEVSLLDLFNNASQYESLAGEIPAQDTAVLRLLLAILHGALGGKTIDGVAFSDDPEDQVDGSLELWKQLWERGLPCQRIENYLMNYEDRFDLFHPETPFYQVAGLKKGTDYSAAKLNGEMSESTNKTRLFSQRAGHDKSCLSFAEAARWLLYINGFDDTSAKPTQKGLPSPGTGWLGKLGLIMAVGDDLQQTLLLNFVLLKDGTYETWGNDRPIWEIPPRTEERVQIPPPNSQSALLTLQSRRLLLKREGKVVVGYTLQGGDFFAKENYFCEQFTIWRNAEKKEDRPPEFVPRRHNASVQMWRDFSPLVEQGERRKRPGIVMWLKYLKTERIIEIPFFRLQITGLNYGDKDFFVEDVINDSLSFNADLLSELHKGWINAIIAELNITDKLVREVGLLAQNIAKAAGIKDGNPSIGKGDGTAARDQARTMAYYRLDAPFRLWLEGIDPIRDRIDDQCIQWWNISKEIIRALGREYMRNCSPQALVGHSTQSAAEAYHWFNYYTYSQENLNKRGVGTRGKSSKGSA